MLLNENVSYSPKKLNEKCVNYLPRKYGFFFFKNVQKKVTLNTLMTLSKMPQTTHFTPPFYYTYPPPFLFHFFLHFLSLFRNNTRLDFLSDDKKKFVTLDFRLDLLKKKSEKMHGIYNKDEWVVRGIFERVIKMRQKSLVSLLFGHFS